MRFLVALALLAAGGCATSRTLCPPETVVARHVYSGGGDAEWCRRVDGVRQGPESRVYENGVESVSGSYVDGAQSGFGGTGSTTAAIGAPKPGTTERCWP